MARLTLQSMMAPGGVLHGGSALMRTLLETPIRNRMMTLQQQNEDRRYEENQRQFNTQLTLRTLAEEADQLRQAGIGTTGSRTRTGGQSAAQVRLRVNDLLKEEQARIGAEKIELAGRDEIDKLINVEANQEKKAQLLAQLGLEETATGEQIAAAIDVHNRNVEQRMLDPALRTGIEQRLVQQAGAAPAAAGAGARAVITLADVAANDPTLVPRLNLARANAGLPPLSIEEMSRPINTEETSTDTATPPPATGDPAPKAKPGEKDLALQALDQQIHRNPLRSQELLMSDEKLMGQSSVDLVEDQLDEMVVDRYKIEDQVKRTQEYIRRIEGMVTKMQSTPDRALYGSIQESDLTYATGDPEIDAMSQELRNAYIDGRHGKLKANHVRDMFVTQLVKARQAEDTLMHEIGMIDAKADGLKRQYGLTADPVEEEQEDEFVSLRPGNPQRLGPGGLSASMF